LGADHHGRVIDQIEGFALASMPITLLNSQNNRRALSRGKGKSIGFADKEF
jgi:hypothetical protein